MAQMLRGDLKAAAAQVEAKKQGGGDARTKPLPDDVDELFESSEVTAPKSREDEVLKMKLQLRKLEIEADKEARKAEAEQKARKAEADTRKAEAEARKLEADKEARKAEAEQETRKMQLEMELKKIELTPEPREEMRGQMTWIRRGPQQL